MLATAWWFVPAFAVGLLSVLEVMAEPTIVALPVPVLVEYPLRVPVAAVEDLPVEQCAVPELGHGALAQPSQHRQSQGLDVF